MLFIMINDADAYFKGFKMHMNLQKHGICSESGLFAVVLVRQMYRPFFFSFLQHNTELRTGSDSVPFPDEDEWNYAHQRSYASHKATSSRNAELLKHWCCG